MHLAWHTHCILIIVAYLRARINMKNLFDKLFKKEPQFNYIIAEYQPLKVDLYKTVASAKEYDIEAPANSDEMEIDKIYQRQ